MVIEYKLHEMSKDIKTSLLKHLVKIRTKDKDIQKLTLTEKEDCVQTFRNDFFIPKPLLEDTDPTFSKEKTEKIFQILQNIRDHVTEVNKGYVILATDYDADGLTANAVIRYMLTKLFRIPSNKIVTINNSRDFGNGVNYTVVERILEACKNKKEPILLLTADHGSSDITNFAAIKSKVKNINIIVTDHHASFANMDKFLEENEDPMDVFINPFRVDGLEISKNLSGCGIAFYTLLLTFVRHKIEPSIEDKEKETILKTIEPCLAYVMLSLYSDVMKLDNYYNRLLAIIGMQELDKHNNYVWKQLFRVCKLTDINNQPKPVNSQIINFKLVPIINTGNRCDLVGEACDVLQYLNTEEASADSNISNLNLNLHILNKSNEDRKNETKIWTQKALLFVNERFVVAFIKPVSHIAGIIASRLKEEHNKSVWCFEVDKGIPLDEFKKLEELLQFMDQEGGFCHGSIRGTSECHVVEVMQEVDKIYPKTFEKFGGHAQAAGCTILGNNVRNFLKALDQIQEKVKENKQETKTSELTIDIDTIFTEETFPLYYEDLIALPEKLEPYGRGWSVPMFIVPAIWYQGTDTYRRLRFKVGDIELKGYLRFNFHSDTYTANELEVSTLRETKTVPVYLIFSLSFYRPYRTESQDMKLIHITVEGLENRDHPVLSKFYTGG